MVNYDKEIIDAYGEHWVSINDYTKKYILLNYGFMYFSKYDESICPSEMFGEDNIEKTFDYAEELAGERPKSLSHLPIPD